MTQTAFESLKSDNSNVLPHRVFMKEAQSYGESSLASREDLEVKVDIFPDGSFTVSEPFPRSVRVNHIGSKSITLTREVA